MVRANHNNVMGKYTLLIPFLLITAALFTSSDVIGAECTSETYSQESPAKQQAAFSPYEKIFVKIHCSGLDAGDHTLYVNWVHGRVGIVRSDKQDFSINVRGGNHAAYFWFKLSRLGPIKSAITNQDFYPAHLGDWAVEVSLGEVPVSSSLFSISETN